LPFSCKESPLATCPTVVKTEKQRTLQRAVGISGIGLFTGEKVNIRLCPAQENTGIVFQRTDLPGRPFLPAKLNYVQGTPRCTIIGDQGASVQTVEHLLSALSGCGIDNLLIEISGAEVPILDGSSRGFVELIELAGSTEQEDLKHFYRLNAPLFWSQNEVHLVALPSDEYRISYTLHYPGSALLRSQFYSFVVTPENYKREIASSRTFSLYEEIAPMIERGLIKGGSLENAVIVKNDAVVNPEGVRFPDEMVRHKILDAIGDLSLVAVPFLAHIIAIRSGHSSNTAFARELLEHINRENL
jgi:UDP-3-O-[3-hydroxymyristoyl] N-acetylglucosamine deacetylase